MQGKKRSEKEQSIRIHQQVKTQEIAELFKRNREQSKNYQVQAQAGKHK